MTKSNETLLVFPPGIRYLSFRFFPMPLEQLVDEDLIVP